MKDFFVKLGVGIAIAIALYISVSGIRYRFAHPEKTETQCILEMGDVLTWK